MRAHLWMILLMEKENSLIKLEFIQDNSKMGSSMDMDSLIGLMGQFIEDILKMGLDKDKESTLILKIQV